MRLWTETKFTNLVIVLNNMSDHTYTCGLCRAESLCQCGGKNKDACSMGHNCAEICDKCKEDCVTRNYKCYNCAWEVHWFYDTITNCEICAKKLCSHCASGGQIWDWCVECMDAAEKKKALKPE